MKKLKFSRPIYIENSKVPVILSYLAPIEISAITLGPLVFSRGTIDERVKRHEAIHWQQWLDTCLIGFPVLYLLFWMRGYLIYKNGQSAYFMIPFEQEAYLHDDDEFYLINRKRFAWWKYYT